MQKSVKVFLFFLLLIPNIVLADNELKLLKEDYARPGEIIKHIPFPEDNPANIYKEKLGKKLFFDKSLTIDQSRSCASCHDKKKGYSDGKKTANDLQNKPLKRTSPAIWNLAFDQFYFWDGRADSLEAQISETLQNPDEMGMNAHILTPRLLQNAEYITLFKRAFAKKKDKNKKAEAFVTFENTVKALAHFVRVQISPVTRFDLWVKGRHTLTKNEIEGFLLFNGKANCSACHTGWRFTDGFFNDIGLTDSDKGRGVLEPKNAAMQHAFKTPGLRDLVNRAPYMHNGSLKTLEEVIDHYDGGELKREGDLEKAALEKGEDISIPLFSQPLNLTADEKKKLILFLKTL